MPKKKKKKFRSCNAYKYPIYFILIFLNKKN